MGTKGRKASEGPSLLKFQEAMRNPDQPLPTWVKVEAGSINEETRQRTPTKYVTDMTLRVTEDGAKVEAVRFWAFEHKAAQTEVLNSASVAQIAELGK